MLPATRRWALTPLVVLLTVPPLAGQVQIRLGDSTRATYSELHEALSDASPAADTVRRVMGESSPTRLWARFRAALEDRAGWNEGLLALTRLAALRDAASVDSAKAYRARILAGRLTAPPGVDPEDLLPALHAIELERQRARGGDPAILHDLLARVPSGRYDLGDAWVFGRLGAGAADSVVGRFLATADTGLRVRYLTLLSFSADTALISFLAGVYLAPDSFGLPRRLGLRASDGLLWIGTRASLQALLTARAAARARGTYDDPRLGHADLDFLGNDSSMVISRSGRWLSD